VRSLLAATAALVLTCSAGARALEVSDVIRLTRFQVEDEVIVAQIRATKARFELSADEIILLKKEGVSDMVIRAMVKTAQQPAAEPAGRDPAPAEPAAEPGTLKLDNRDVEDCSVRIDPKKKLVLFWKAVESENRDKLESGKALVYKLAPGKYGMRWVGGLGGQSVEVKTGKETHAVLTRTELDAFDALMVVVYEEGKRVGGGQLARLEDRSPAAAGGSPRHTGRTVVVDESPAPVYYDRYYYPRHPLRVRSSGLWAVPSVGYTWRRGKSRYVVGWNPYCGTTVGYRRRVGRGRYWIDFGW
jgi:hypothetical protein